MSDLPTFRFTARAVLERAGLQHDAGQLDDKQYAAITSVATTLDRVLDDFDKRVSADRSTFLPERLPQRIADAATTARAALTPLEVVRDAAVREASTYPAHVSTIEPNGDGSFRPRRSVPEPTALELAKLSFLWSRFAVSDPADLRRQYAVESGKGEQADRLFLTAVETCPVPVLDESTTRIAQHARLRSLGLEQYAQSRDSVAGAITMLVDAGHAVIDAIAGAPAGVLRRASDGAAVDLPRL